LEDLTSPNTKLQIQELKVLPSSLRRAPRLKKDEQNHSKNTKNIKSSQIGTKIPNNKMLEV